MENKDLVLDEGAWQSIKDHVKRNKGKYAALAGGALAAGLGYAANKGVLGQGAQEFTQKAITSGKDLYAAAKDKLAAFNANKSDTGKKAAEALKSNAAPKSTNDGINTGGTKDNLTPAPKSTNDSVRADRTGGNPTPAPKYSVKDLQKKNLEKIAAEKGKPQTVAEKIAAAQGSNDKLPAGVTPTKPKAVAQMEKRIADKGKVTTFDKLKGAVSKDQNLLNQIASGKGYDKIDTQTALDKGVLKAKNLGQKLKEGFINLNNSVDKNAANYEAQEKKLGTSARNLFTKPLRG